MPLTMTMIGASGTGKSCYLYGTYAAMLEGISLFHFTPKDYNQGLELEEAWELIMNDGHWPSGHVESADYIFDCLHHGVRIGTFTWQDYRGGILTEKKGDDAPEDVQAFHQRCRNADTLLVCIPADVLLKAAQGNSQSDHMLSRYLRIMGGFPNLINVPVVLMITKSDLITDEETRQCISHLLERFNRLLTINHEWLMIVPVSLGRFHGDMVQNGKVDGNVEPKRLHLPILFPIYLELSKIAIDDRRTGQEHSDRTGWGKFWYGDESEHYYRMAREREATMAAIWKEFEGAVDIYQNGNPILNSSGALPQTE